MDSDTGCAVGILIDLSEPVPNKTDSAGEDKENSAPVTEPIEVTRKASQSDSKSDVVEDCLKQDFGGKEKHTETQKSLSDVQLIDDEVFDFDLPVSPESAKEEGTGEAKGDDEEVFFGPVGFTEKCIAAGVAEEAIQPLSPLRPDQMAELAKEAYSVACRIALMNHSTDTEASSPAKPPKPVLCRRKLTPLVRDNAADGQEASVQGHQGDTDSRSVSPRKRRRYSTGVSKARSENASSDSAKKGHERKGTFTKEEPVESLLSSHMTRPEKQEQRAERGCQGGHPGTSRLQPPSKLRRYNNSQPNLARPKEVGESSEDQGNAEHHATASIPPVARKSLQLPRAARPQAGRLSKLALPTNRSSTLPTAQQSGVEKVADPPAAAASSRKSSGIPKGLATKLQLLQPGQLQRRTLAVARGKGVASSACASTGPLRAAHAQPVPGMGSTVERPHNPALAAAAAAAGSSGGGNMQCPSTPAAPKAAAAGSSGGGNMQCPSTPAAPKAAAVPLRVMSLSGSEASTPAKSSCPMSVGSSSSSVSKRSLASSSDAADSPVFETRISSRLARSRRISGAKESCTSSDLDGTGISPLAFKARKPPVQNTPELPKRTRSVWSPVRKAQSVPLEDQVSMCTKRYYPKR